MKQDLPTIKPFIAFSFVAALYTSGGIHANKKHQAWRKKINSHKVSKAQSKKPFAT